MQASLLRELRCRHSSLRARWATLLHVEPVTTPLGLPDMLVRLIDTTLEEIFVALDNPPKRPRINARGVMEPRTTVCPCGLNPLLAYFMAAEQALREGLIVAQVACAPLDPIVRDSSLEELNTVFQRISRREIEAFCGVCQFRHLALPSPVQGARDTRRVIRGVVSGATEALAYLSRLRAGFP